MLLEHQGVRKGSFFKMLTGSIHPGPSIILIFYFILNKSCDFVDVHANINKHSVLTSTMTTTMNTATTVQRATTAPPAPPQLNNNNNNKGWGRVEHEKSAQTTQDASSGP